MDKKKALSALRSRSIAVGSGKGGVGKSTTAVNLAVYYAARRLRVGLVDLDPLANVATILDVPERDIAHISAAVNRRARVIEDYRYVVSPRLHLLFPRPKLERGESTRVMGLLHNAFAPVLLRDYDVLVFDMPAGISKEENLAFLPHIAYLLIVANPQPTSHVSAGGYVKAALEIAPEIRIMIWHNRYSQVGEGSFNPRAVLANYNGYVPDELKLPRRVVLAQRDVAFIPDDPSLDLLQNEVGIETGALIKLLEVTGLLFDRLLLEQPPPEIDGVEADRVRFYIQRHRELLLNPRGADYERIVKDLSPKAGTRAAAELRVYLERIAGVASMSLAADAAETVARRLEEVRESSRLFSGPRTGANAPALERRVVALLQHLSAGHHGSSSFVRNTAGLLLCYYCVYRLVRVESVAKIMTDFIPMRTVNGGKKRRDKRRQIGYLLQRDELYHRRYFALIKRLYPLLSRQISGVAKALRLSELLLRDRDGRINRNAYLVLLTNFVHDTVHTGLGIFVGFRFNAASRAIQDGAAKVLQAAGISPPPGGR